MQLNLQITGLEKVKKQLAALSGPQLREAQAKAINDTAFHVRKVMQAEAAKVFDRPTPYVLRSFLFEKATPDKLQATVLPTYYGGKGVDPQQILRAQEAGGTRHDKRIEVALRRAGWLPAGYQTAIPKTPFPGSHDGRGNLTGAFVTQLLSYFQAFPEQGYRMNMTKARIKSLKTGTKKQQAMVGPFMGRRYFVAGGRTSLQIEGGDRMVMKESGGARFNHLQRGIYASLGVSGRDIRPVLIFVKTPRYQARFSMERVAKAADANEYMAKRMRYRIRQAYEGMSA